MTARTAAPVLSILLLSLHGCQQKPARTAAIDAVFTAYFPAGEPGGAVLIMKGDSVVFSKGYGVADLATGEPITPATLFNLGSISKTFVANAILLLQEQGKLSLDDSLLMYFPEFKHKDIAARVKIKHLLTHTSGLPDNRHVARDTAFYLTAKDAANWAPEMQVDSLLFEPGSQYEYSNPAFNGLALIVEKVAGMKWQAFVTENILKPARMVTSTITDGPHPEHGVAHAYVMNHGQWTEDDYGEEPTFPAAGNGGVWSSVEELARYEQAHRHATFLEQQTIAAARTARPFENWAGDKPPFIGWSWFVGEFEGLKTVGHPGSQGGFLTNYVSIPEKEIFLVVLCNAPREAYEMKEVTNTVLDEIRKERWFE